MSYWVMPSPSSKVWSASTSSHHALSMMAAVAPTIFPSCLPLLVMWPTTWMRAISGSPSLVIIWMATHLPSGETLFEVGLKERQSPQLGASHRVTASSSHRGPCAGTWLASALRGEGHVFGPDGKCLWRRCYVRVERSAQLERGGCDQDVWLSGYEATASDTQLER